MTHEEFLEIVRYSHKQLSRVQVFLDQELVEDTFYQGNLLALDAPATSLTYNRLAETRTSGRVKFWWRGDGAEELVDPLNNIEFHLYHGIEVGGEHFWWKLGAMRATDMEEVQFGESLSYSLNLVDRSEIFRDHPFTVPWLQPDDWTYQEAIKYMLEDRNQFAPLEMVFAPSSGLLTPEAHYGPEDNVWTEAQKLAEAEKCELYHDKDGVVRLNAIDDPLDNKPIISVNGDDYRIQIGSTSRSKSRREVVNGVICRGSAPWLLFPIQGEAWDENPLSDTWRFGSFGERPMFIDDPVATSDAQCQEIAAAELLRRKGVIQDVRFNMVKDPYLDVGHTIERVGLDHEQEYYVLEELNFPLGPATMSGTVRRKT